METDFGGENVKSEYAPTTPPPTRCIQPCVSVSPVVGVGSQSRRKSRTDVSSQQSRRSALQTEPCTGHVLSFIVIITDDAEMFSKYSRAFLIY
jgi:hypothetical protein